jgi:glutamate-5-semialdehyde dehydrogenase
MEKCVNSTVVKIAAAAKAASAQLACLSAEQKDRALLSIADALESNADIIVAENRKDLDAAKKALASGSLKESLYHRLKLDETKLASTIEGIRQIALMKDPIGELSLARELDEDLTLYRVSCPIGLIAVIFEARPEAMPQILSLCLKTANALILKGGSEAEHSNRILFQLMQNAVIKAGLPGEALALIETRAQISEILQANESVDLIIPRGSNDLVRYIQSNTRIPVLGHADGICHIYVDNEAELGKAEALIIDSKIQYPSACNAVETVLLHKDIAANFLPQLCAALQKNMVEVRLDSSSLDLLKKQKHNSVNLEQINLATEKDWKTEYCDLILSIKIVDSIEEAISHINKYGSGHTDAMVSQNEEKFGLFFAQVNSAGVYLNASTRFADGFRYGFGAEVGISTSKLHPRGPVGIEGLLTYKYKLIGKGQIVADYVGATARKFTHIDLPWQEARDQKMETRNLRPEA